MQGLALRLQLRSRMQGRLRQGWAPVFTSDRAIFRAILALVAALAVIGASIVKVIPIFIGFAIGPNTFFHNAISFCRASLGLG
jgi:hypothetical protein